MSRMFLIDGKPMTTWNIFVGCKFECTYCNARKAALSRFRHSERYRDGFRPKYIKEELRRRFKPGEWVFVAYMGDIACASREVVINILERIQDFPETNFLFCTKHPLIYWFWHLAWPDNCHLGATIETTEDYKLSLAPIPRERYRAMIAAELEGKKKFISIEPIMDFKWATMVKWMEEIKPSIIEIGADNYQNRLKEPPPWKVKALLRDLKGICPVVVEKPGLERLTGEVD